MSRYNQTEADLRIENNLVVTSGERGQQRNKIGREN